MPHDAVKYVGTVSWMSERRGRAGGGGPANSKGANLLLPLLFKPKVALQRAEQRRRNYWSLRLSVPGYGSCRNSVGVTQMRQKQQSARPRPGREEKDEVQAGSLLARA
eukprot:3200557-Rhodomonas_salina.3